MAQDAAARKNSRALCREWSAWDMHSKCSPTWTTTPNARGQIVSHTERFWGRVTV